MLRDKPEAIMINVPEAYFAETKDKEKAFRRFYETMGGDRPDGCFYHWISSIPVHEVTTVYVCFKGLVQYKAIVVQYIRNGQPFQGWECRNYLVTTGPVVKAPEGMKQKGFRGFRYTQKLF